MTLPSSGTITILQIYNEAQLSASSTWYNKGTNLGAYRGLQWWQDNTVTGYFPSGAIAMSDFYSKRGTTPVNPNSQSFGYTGGNQSFTIPLYSTLTVILRAGGGGGGGGGGNLTNGGTGGTGGTTVFYHGPNYYAYGGTGGCGGGTCYSNGTAGPGSDGSPGGGGGGNGTGGGSGGYTGGAGGKNVLTFTNPVSGGTGPTVGSSVLFFIGNGGGGGGYGQSISYGLPYNSDSGSGGGAGSILFQWA